MRWVRDFLKEVVQLVTPKAVSAAMAAWIMACRICFQVIFFELFIGIFVLKDLFFSVIPDKDEESVGIKMIAFRFFTLFRTTVSFQKDKSLRKYRSTSEQQFYFRKADLYRNTGLLQNNRFISERQILSDFRSPESSGVFFRLVIRSGSLSRQVHSVFPRFQGFNHQLGGLSGRDQVEYAVFQQAEETGSGFPAHVQVFHMDGGIVCFQ